MKKLFLIFLLFLMMAVPASAMAGTAMVVMGGAAASSNNNYEDETHAVGCTVPIEYGLENNCDIETVYRKPANFKCGTDYIRTDCRGTVLSTNEPYTDTSDWNKVKKGLEVGLVVLVVLLVLLGLIIGFNKWFGKKEEDQRYY